MSNKLIILLLLSNMFSLPSQAEDYDEDEDLEYFFKSRQKSTLEDFPLQEIGGDELSDAAIAGALRADTATGQDAKPVYVQEKEESDKKKAGEALEQDELLKIDGGLQLNQFQISTPEFQAPIYQQPNGRTYGDHITHTIERP